MLCYAGNTQKIALLSRSSHSCGERLTYKRNATEQCIRWVWEEAGGLWETFTEASAPQTCVQGSGLPARAEVQSLWNLQSRGKEGH